MHAPSVTNTFFTSWHWLCAFNTDVFGSRPIRAVPISWMVKPGGFSSTNGAMSRAPAASSISAAVTDMSCSSLRSLEEIVEASGITDQDRSSVKLASKYYRMMVMEMGVFTEQSPAAVAGASQSTKVQAIALAIDHYISKLVNMAKIDTKVERLAIEIAHKTDDHLLADGKAPNGLAAAYIYIASMLLGVNILQRDVSSLSGVTEVTIRNRCKDILTSFKMTVTVRPAQVRPGFAA